MEKHMLLREAKQKFLELQTVILDDYFYQSNHENELRSMIDLLREHPVLCSDALNMIGENSRDISMNDKKDLINNIFEIKPELSIDIIRRMGEFDIDSEYKISKVVDVLREHPNLGKQIIKSIEDWDYLNDEVLGEIVKNQPELFSSAEKITYNRDYLVRAIVDTKDKLSEKDVDMIMGEFSFKKFRNLYSEDMVEGLKFVEKFSKGNPENTEIQKKCLLLLQIYNSDSKAKSITHEILTQQPKLKEFSDSLNLLKLRTLASSEVEKIDDKKDSVFAYTTGHSDLTQIQDRVILKGDRKNIIASYLKQREKEQEFLNSPEKLNKLLNEIDFSDDTSIVLAPAISKIVERTKNEDVLKILLHKKEEAYGVWDYDGIRKLEECFASKNYIEKTLNKKYPNLSLEEQLIQAAYDVVNSGDEQKKKEFNEFILAEGEPRLSELDAKVMDYLYENCTQNNLDKVNALRSFYGLKVELKTGNTVDIDERTAVRKVFDRTWSSYERGKNYYTGEPYYSEREMDDARKEDPERVISNPYYENAVSPAYRKYFEEHDIYEIYNRKKSDEDKKYSTQDYFDSLIDKSPFKALRKHGLYNDMKIICETLVELQVEPEISSQFNLKDLSDMVVNSHNTLENRKVYTQDTEEYMFTKSPHTDELNGLWRDPYYWHQWDYDDDEYYDEYGDDGYKMSGNHEAENSANDKKYDKDGFEIIPDTYSEHSEANEEPAARDTWWENLADHNPKAVKHISEAFARHGREDYAISGFWEAARHGTPGVGSRRDERLLSATLHHAEAIQYGGNDDKKNFVGATRYYDSYGDTFDEDEMHVDYHKSFHRRDTPMDALYINSNANSADDKLAITDKLNENAQKAFLETSFTDPHMHFYAGFRKKDQYTAPLYHMRNIEKEKQERVDKTEKTLEYLTKLGNVLSSISICISEALKTEEKIVTATRNITQKVKKSTNHNKTPSVNAKHTRYATNNKSNNNQHEL